MRYNSVLFLVKNAFTPGLGWCSPDSKRDYANEFINLFERSGWTIGYDKDLQTDCAARGKEQLFAYSSAIRGVVRPTSIIEVVTLLNSAQTMTLEHVSRYGDVYDIPKQQYLSMLDNNQSIIIEELLMLCQSPARRFDVVRTVAEKYYIPRIDDQAGDPMGMVRSYVNKTLEQIIKTGLILKDTNLWLISKNQGAVA